MLLTSIKVSELRTLLPVKLVNPARIALDTPGQYDPEKLATYLTKAATAGSQELERFKQDWHSDDMRNLLQTAMREKLTQGRDAWMTDYRALLQEAASNEHKPTSVNNASRDFQPPNEAEIRKVVDDFRARHPELKLHVSDGPMPLPVDIHTSSYDFRVELTQSTGGVEFSVVQVPNTTPNRWNLKIIQAIGQYKEQTDLPYLLVREH